MVAVVMAQPNCNAPSTGLVPINDLGSGMFNNMTGGLYPGGNNDMPAAHKNAGISVARSQIFPRNASGNPDSVNGKIVWLSIGMSNCTQEAQQFIIKANAYAGKNPKLVFVDGAQGGQTANIISTPGNASYPSFWNTVSTRISNAGLSPLQVQVIWFKEANQAGTTPIKEYYDSLVVQFKRAMNEIKSRFPNATLCYMASRISARYASSALNPEPYAYWTGWAVKKVIEDQINGDTQLRFSGANPNSPHLSWGIYMWSDGSTPQVTNPNIFWNCSTDFQNDGTHPSSPVGASKVADLLLSFYQNDSLSCSWFFNTPPAWCIDKTGIVTSTNNAEEVKIFPNPANTFIEIKTIYQNFSVSLFDNTGKLIMQLDHPRRIEIGNLPPGLYRIMVRSVTGASQSLKLNLLNR